MAAYVCRHVPTGSIALTESVAVCACVCRHVPTGSIAHTGGCVEKRLPTTHSLKPCAKPVFGDLVSGNWTLPRGGRVGESLRQIYVAVFCGEQDGKKSIKMSTTFLWFSWNVKPHFSGFLGTQKWLTLSRASEVLLGWMVYMSGI